MFPGKRMAGHLGDVHAHRAEPEIVRIDAERQLLLIKGAVPGRATAADVDRAAVAAKAPAKKGA